MLFLELIHFIVGLYFRINKKKIFNNTPDGNPTIAEIFKSRSQEKIPAS